jgi:NitT/TauT family transport system ATP-binding protein
MNEIHGSGKKDVEWFLNRQGHLAGLVHCKTGVKLPRPNSKQRPTTARPVVRIGFIALVDALPLLAAEKLGLFAKHGVNVELTCEVGWATVREKILYRQLDAAHAVAGLALSLRLGIDGTSCPAIAPFVFNLHGNAVTLGMDLWRRGVRDAVTLQKLIRSTPQRLFTFGIVSRSSSHHILMRRWLMGGGINPDRDVRIVVLPPTLMASSLRAGLVDGFCAGEPWNSAAVARGDGWCPVVSKDLAPLHPEKVLLTTEDFSNEQPARLRAVIRALHEACAWCDRKENRARAVEILCASGHFPHERETLRASLIGPFLNGAGGEIDADSFHLFHRENANEPVKPRAQWLVREFLDHGLIHANRRGEALQEMDACWRADLFHDALPHRRSAKSKPLPNSKLKRARKAGLALPLS